MNFHSLLLPHFEECGIDDLWLLPLRPMGRTRNAQESGSDSLCYNACASHQGFTPKDSVRLW